MKGRPSPVIKQEQLPLTHLLETAQRNQRAWAKWKGFPTRKTEAFRYISLKTLEQTPDFILGSVDFEYDTPTPLIILPLEQAKKTYGSLLEKRLAFLSKKTIDPFFWLNQAVSSEGLFIYVPPHVQCDQVLNITQSIEKRAVVHPRIEMFLGEGARLTTFVKTGGSRFWSNATINVTAGRGAHYTHYDMAGHHENSWDFLSVQAEIKESAVFNYFSLGRGAHTQRRDLALYLSGMHATADVKGLSLLSNRLEGHVHIRIEHQKPHTHSHQCFKHVVSQRARSSFEGKIYVDQEAQKTQAYQLNNNLVLSQHAAAFSKPNLEIFADDVKASHGATVSKPRLDELFYLRSRGLSEQEATNHLVRGFCRALVQEISITSLRHQFSREIDAYLF